MFDGVRASAGNSFVFETEVPLMFNQTFDPGFTVALHCKDLAIGKDIAKRSNTPIPLHDLAQELYDQTGKEYGGEVGSSSPARRQQDQADADLTWPGYNNWSYTIEAVDGGGLAVVHKTK